MELTASPVKRAAAALGIPVTQPEKIKNNQDFREQLEGLAPEAIVVVGYGRIVPQWMLDLPLYGNINLHASLLPKYRGAAPIQWAIAEGEAVTGATTMRIDAGLDTGDILLQEEVGIRPEETSETLALRLAAIGAELMVRTLQEMAEGRITPVPQDGSQATLAPILKKDDGLIDFTSGAGRILNRMRGFQPWPGAFTRFRGKTLHLWRAAMDSGAGVPGVIRMHRDRIFAGCGEGNSLELLEVQIEGKKRMSARDFVHGYRPQAGEALG